MDDPLTVLELYSGIGGMHYALKQTNIKHKVLAAFDINTTANIVYKHNFPDTRLLQKNIEGFTVDYLDGFDADIWTMSPPCQPYTRQGKQEASNDARSRSFMNILKIMEKMMNPPRYIFMENVKGFEASNTREMFLTILKSRNYIYQEFLVSPSDFGIPNSRMRYYLLAKNNKNPFPFLCTVSPLSCTNETICDLKCNCCKINDKDTLTFCVREELANRLQQCPQRKISEFIVVGDEDSYLLNRDVLTRYHSILDIVNRDLSHSCCFTKSYGKYVEGTGSVFTEQSMEEVKKIYEQVATLSSDEEKYVMLSRLKLRHFAPKEIANLMCFPVDLNFPDDTTVKQRYRLLGNSVNVLVISSLMKWFLVA